jgi:signal transduction histidine kinase/CheY-like chemotaxis protein/HPt (histidine-containing phosphotransfer) domain-containing protein
MKGHSSALSARIDRFFGRLLLVESSGIVAVAAWAPRLRLASVADGPRVLAWSAIMCALIAVPTCLLVRSRAGFASTRCAIAVAEMLLGTVLIDVCGGRSEAYFFVFTSLAFLAAYRDWRVLVTAALVFASDDVLCLILSSPVPRAPPGTTALSVAEHLFWIVIETTGLTFLSQEGIREVRQTVKERVELEKRIHVEAQVAQQSNRVKSEFLANMSHEIRTPMTAIQGYAELLLDVTLGASERREYLLTIRRNSAHLLRLLDGILDLSKIEAGKITVERVDCSPAELVADVASLMRVRATEKALTFAVEFTSPVPATIKSDPTRVRQILLNLVGNAIKFTETGSVHVYVRCEGPDSIAPFLAIEIADTGVGLSKAQVSNLFADFTQADSSTTRRFGGTGLGLSIARRLANLLGGDIAVESLPGRGSSFTLHVPTGPLRGVRMLNDLREGGAEPVAEPASGVTPLRLNARVLLAEDGPDNQLLIATHLRRAGAEVFIVETGKRAVEAALAAEAAGDAFEVVIMDMQMPVMDGYVATTTLRASGYTGPIVALTAQAMEGDRQACIAAGCDEYLTKPVDRAKLLSTVSTYSNRSRAAVAVAETLLAGTAPAPPKKGPSEKPPSSAEPLESELANDPDVADIVAEFVKVAHARSASILAAVNTGDNPTLARLVHQLKGAAGGYGFPSITEQARVVEAALASGDRKGLLASVVALSTLCARTTYGGPPPAADALG